MFSFHKGDALPRSRQSSVDSQLFLPPLPDADPPLDTHDATPSSVYAPLHHLPFSARRSSVFKIRSRSNTATSTTPSLLSISHSELPDHDTPWQPAVQPLSSASQVPSDMSKPGARRSLFRGRKGKRNSDVTTPSTPEPLPTDLAQKRSSVLRKERKPSHESPNPLLHQISKPFDFQHLSHADRNQVAALEKASSEQATSSGLSVRPSRSQSRGFPAGKEDPIRFRDLSPRDTTGLDPHTMALLDAKVHSHSQIVPSERHHPELVSQSVTALPNLRMARSVESFSQPGVSSRKHSEPLNLLTQPASSPWRAPLATAEADSGHHEAPKTMSGSSRSKRESGVWDSFVFPAVTAPDPTLANQEDSYFGHALTTPDDSAIHAVTPPFSPSLADVAEEPERVTNLGLAPPSPPPPPPAARTPSTPKSPFFESFSFADRRSPPPTPRSQSHPLASPRGRPAGSRRASIRTSSQVSETLGSHAFIRRTARPSISNRCNSNIWRAIESSWEEDVDFIYENALEADCDSAWDRPDQNPMHYDRQKQMHPSQTAPNENRDVQYAGTARDTAAELAPDEMFPGTFRTSLLVPSTNSLPDLAPASATSASTLSTGLPTPSEAFSPNCFGLDEGFVLTPSLLIPQDFKEMREALYDDLLDEYNSFDRHFPMMDPSQSVNSSTRSSRVRFSRRSSYDSSMVSVLGSGLWSYPARRSASSAGSVPDLVPSRRSRKDAASSFFMDNVSERVAHSAHGDMSHGEEDVTPMRRARDGQSPWTTEEQETDHVPTLVASELKESLELARRGSEAKMSTGTEESQVASHVINERTQRTDRSPMRQHKPTLSDSAAKVLAGSSINLPTAKALSRARAATTAQTRQPLLSLFPSPPRQPIQG